MMPQITVERFSQVTYYIPGSFMPETSVQKVETDNPIELAKMAPHLAYCFVIETFETKSVNVEGEDFQKTELVHASGRFYLGGKLFTSEELKREFEGDQSKESLIWNMENNDWPRVIQCPRGNWQPFYDVDTLLPVAA